MPDSLIVNSPYHVPGRHWQGSSGGTLSLVEGRRAGGCEIFDIRNNTRRIAPLDRDEYVKTRYGKSDSKEHLI